MICVPSFSKRCMMRSCSSLAALAVLDAVGEVDRRRAHARVADHPDRVRRRRVDVAADPGRRLVVEDVLGRHRAEAPDQAGDLLGAPFDEAVLDPHRLVVAARVAALADREPRREHVVGVEVRAHGVAGLVDGDRALLVLGVGLADGHAGLDRRHRLEQVLPLERLAAVGVRVGQRHRADLVDHRRRVAVGDARELVALARRVERLGVRHLVQVEVEDVAPVLPRGRAEVDVAAHPARPRQRRVEALERHVARPDEVDLLLVGLRRLASAASASRACAGRCRARRGRC